MQHFYMFICRLYVTKINLDFIQKTKLYSEESLYQMCVNAHQR